MGDRVARWFVGLWIVFAVACSDGPAKRSVSDAGVETVIGYNHCPEITSIVISPVSLGIGAEAHLEALVEDIDSDPLGYSWFAESGEIVTPQSLSSAYRCVLAGRDYLAFAVADVHGCIAQKSSAVECTP